MVDLNSSAGVREHAPTADARFLLVGSGLLARHWAHYMTLLQIPFVAWNRREGNVASLPALLADRSHVLLAISDAAIPEFFEKHLRGFKGKTIHFSGAHEFAGITGVHPLMSFGPTLYDLDHYRAIPFVSVEDSGLPGFPNKVFHISAEDKSRYHALCVIGGNFSVIIWQKFFHEMAKLGIPMASCLPYFHQVNENIAAAPFAALTGPLKRGDIQTMQLNLAALDGDPFRGVYRHFVHAYEEQIKDLQTPKEVL